MRFLMLFALSFVIQDSFYIHDSNIDSFNINNDKTILLTSNESVYSVDMDGQIDFEYNGEQYGRIQSIDQTSSLRLMVFFKDQAKFVILDNTLTPQGPVINLNQHDLSYITLICASENNNYWCYSSEINAIIRVNQQLIPISTGEDLNQLLDRVVSPTFITEQNGKVYLNDPKNGIHIFDTYGSFEKTIPAIGTKQIVVKNSSIYYSIGNTISRINESNNNDEVIFTASIQIDYFDIENNVIYIGNKNKIESSTIE